MANDTFIVNQSSKLLNRETSATFDYNGIEKRKYPNGEEIPVNKTYSTFRICAMIAPGFSWGFVSTTMLLLTLPLECQRVGGTTDDSSSSIYLAMFIFLAGLTQLVCPLVGKLSDESEPIPNYWGRRIPFILLGSSLSIISLIGMTFSSWFESWVPYAISYVLFMIAMNVVYSSMIALIPDLIPNSQVGQANGLFALEMVLGSVFGFSFFEILIDINHSHYDKVGAVKLSTSEMYILYMMVLLVTSVITVAYTDEKTSINLVQNKDSILRDTSLHTGSARFRVSKLILIWKRAFEKAMTLEAKEVFGVFYLSPQRHGDFFFVTLSRTFYYMGISVQTFFLYFIHDILRDHSALARRSPQSLVSILALVTQFSGAFLCYPAGYISDKYLDGRRKPFIYLFCAMLSMGSFSLIFVNYVNQLYVVCVVVGLANGGYLTMETSLAVDALEKMEEMHKEKIHSEIPVDIGGYVDSDKIKAEGAAQLLGIWGVAAFIGKNYIVDLLYY